MKYLALALFLFTVPASAAPICNAMSLGTVQCMSGIMCECGFVRGGTITNDRGGYRWDCGIKRPVCLDYNKIESKRRYEGPAAVGIDKSTSIINNN